jgi:hypothetical protein
MTRQSEVIWLSFILGAALLLSLLVPDVRADTSEFRQSTQLYPSEYMLQSRDPRHDPVFDQARTIDLSATVGSDCGRIDMKSTLRSTLGNVLNSNYFGDMGKDIIAASPMLLTCYFSPTWCAILKHSQISAHWLSKMRLDQCSLVDKYVDHRVEDYYQERQSCVRQAIDQNGGDMESAMQACNGNSLWQGGLSNWAGAKNGDKVTTNRLIESSAKWAGMDGSDSRNSLDLVKALVGDTVISQGSVSVEYGPQKAALTPRTYLQSISRTTHDKLCEGLVKKVAESDVTTPIEQVVSDQDLKDLSPDTDHVLVDRQTIQSLAVMGPRQRTFACQKLSDAMAMSIFSTDVNRSLDILSTLSQNPNLPDNRRAEIEAKRKALKDQIELTVTLQNTRNRPLNEILSQINEEGQTLQSGSVRDDLLTDESSQKGRAIERTLMDCSDGSLCEGGH